MSDNKKKQKPINQNFENQENTNENFGEAIEIVNSELIPEEEREITKDIFLRVMEDEMLKDIPVSQQSNFFIQKKINKEARELWDLKEEGDKIISRENAGVKDYRPFLDFLDQGFFHKTPWVYPVVLDKHIIYALHCGKKHDKWFDLYDEDEDNEFTGEVPFGDEMENEKNQMKFIQTSIRKLFNGSINFVNFSFLTENKRKPYLPPSKEMLEEKGIPSSYKIKLRDYEQVFRFIDLEKKNKTRIARGPWTIPVEIPEKNKKTEKIFKNLEYYKGKRKIITAVSGEELFIVGFLLIPNAIQLLPEELAVVAKEAIKNKIIITDKKDIPSFSLEKPSFFLFQTKTKDVPSSLYAKILHKFAPSSEKAISMVLEKMKSFTILEIEDSLKKWGIPIKYIEYDCWKKTLQKLSEFANEQTFTILNRIDPSKIGNPCTIKGKDELLRDDQYLSPFMRLSYEQNLGYTEDESSVYRGPDCWGHRFAKLYETDDNGSFYYSYSYLHLRKGNLKKELTYLLNVQKKFKEEQKKLFLEAKKEGASLESFQNIAIDSLEVIKKKFNSFMSIPENVYIARKKIPFLEKQIEESVKAQNKLEQLKTILEKTSFRKAGRLFLYQLQNSLYKEHNYSHKEHHNSLDKEHDNKPLKLFSFPPAIQSILNQINSLSGIQNKKEIIYRIIENDGLLVGKYIYSIRYGNILFCGHWYYSMLAEKSSYQSIREKWTQQLLSIFGESSTKESNCMICGAYLDRPALYETMYIDQGGYPIALREALVDEKQYSSYLHTKDLKSTDIFADEIRICDGPALKSEIASQGWKENKDKKNAVFACNIIDGLCKKMNILLPPKQFLGIILISLRNSKNIYDFNVYFENKINEIKNKKKISEKEAIKLKQNKKITEKIVISYAAYFSTKFATLVASHLLWHLRTVVPPITPGGKSISTSCSFFGFDGDPGMNYIKCLLIEMKVIRAKATIYGKYFDKPVSKEVIEKNLRYWVNLFSFDYKQAVKKKIVFEANLKKYIEIFGSKRLDRGERKIKWEDLEIKKSSDTFEKDFLKEWKKGNVKQIRDFVMQNSLRAKKISFLFLKEINNILIEVGTNDKPPYIETSCCSVLLKKNESFLDFYNNYENKKSSLLEFSLELEELEKNLLFIKTFFLNAQFCIESIQKPMGNLNNYPIQAKDFPDSFVKDALLTFCHDGESKAEYHNFQGSFEETIRCIKCDWLKKELEKESFKFNKNELNVLLLDVGRKTFVNLPEFEKIEKNIKLLTNLKREASKNINNEIILLSSKLAKAIFKNNKKESEKTLKDRFQKFLKNIDNFENYIPTPKTTNDEVIVKTLEKRDTFAQQKMKTYINDFLRKNISRVANGYKIKTKKIPNISKKEEEKWQNKIIDDVIWIENFLKPYYKKLFQKMKFDFSIKQINEINGISNVYDNQYKWIKIPSFFTPNDSVKFLKYYFIHQISNFLDVAGRDDYLIADFIRNLFKKIEKDRDTLNLSKKEITKWKDSNQEKRYLDWAKYFDIIKEEDSLLFNTPYRQFTKLYFDPYSQPEEESLTLGEDKFNKDIEEASQESYLYNKAKEELGEDTTEQAIQSYVDDAIQEEEINQDINEEIYDQVLLPEGEDIMEIGDDYGEMPQGTETEGDGFNDYTMNELWEPIHEPDVLGSAQ
jgi:hypothetical protein